MIERLRYVLAVEALVAAQAVDWRRRRSSAADRQRCTTPSGPSRLLSTTTDRRAARSRESLARCLASRRWTTSSPPPRSARADSSCELSSFRAKAEVGAVLTAPRGGWGPHRLNIDVGMPELISPPPAPGEHASTALALVNTEIEPRGRPVDLLPDGRALADWLRARGLRAGRSASIADQDLGRVRELRTAIRAAFIARATGRRPSRTAIASINTAAALVPSTPRLAWTDDGPGHETVWAQGARAADVVLAEIAANAIAILLGDSGSRLRLCEAHGCNRMFIQDHRRRRWCSRTCGDRVRVAHYRKTNEPH
jgi:predicted RNA-binding Zn ribbon-like protein